MERRRLYSAGGFGLLFAVYVGMIGHPGESAGEFFFGSSLGIACAGVLAAAAGLALQRGRVSRLSDRFMSLLVLVLGFGIALVGAILRFLGALGYAAAPSLSGILFGAGCLFLALVWTRIYAAYHFIEALRRGSLALLCSVFFSLVMSFVPNAAVVDGCYVAALCFSLPFALYELLRIQGLDRPTADVAREGGRARPLRLACENCLGPFVRLGHLFLSSRLALDAGVSPGWKFGAGRRTRGTPFRGSSCCHGAYRFRHFSHYFLRSGTEALLGCHAHYGRYLPNNAFLGRGDAALLEPACLESSKRRFDLHGVLHLGTAAPRLAHQRVFR